MVGQCFKYMDIITVSNEILMLEEMVSGTPEEGKLGSDILLCSLGLNLMLRHSQV